MSGYDSPNYTQTPNDLFDRDLADMGYAELKVTLAVVRLTFGYHRNRARASLSAIMKATGLTRANVNIGAKQAEERGTIRRIQDGGVTVWEAVTADYAQGGIVEIPPKKVTGIAEIPAVVSQQYQTGIETIPPSKKETSKERRNKNTTGANAPGVSASAEQPLLFPAGEKPPKTRKPADTAHQARFAALMRVTKADEKAAGGYIGKAARDLSHYTAEQIERWYGAGGWWYAVHCAGMDKPPTPSLAGICRTIGQAAEWAGRGVAATCAGTWAN